MTREKISKCRSAKFIVFGAVLGFGCASSSDTPDAVETGSTVGTGGGSGTDSGGANPATSGAGYTASGGSAGGGGSSTRGGTAAAGGNGMGGSVASGSAAATGGNAAAAGGGSTGGAPGNGGGSATGGQVGDGGAGGSRSLHPVKYVFVIAMENHDGTSIYGNTTSAPYINGTLIPKYARASAFTDPLPLSVPSEPHYVWMEAGTNAFADYTFTNDDDPSATNSTTSTAHLSTQIDSKGLTWRAYQEGLDSSTGACPIHTSGFYAPKHDPFVFFQDVSGNPPSDSNAYCTEHHRPLSALAQDLQSNSVASYNFITPNLCGDMHGQFGCPSIDLVKPGDDWLAANVPALVSFANANDGVIFVIWDEGEGSTTLPFLAVGPSIKSGYSSGVTYTHSSLVKSVEEIFGLSILPTVAAANDFADLFEPGAFP